MASGAGAMRGSTPHLQAFSLSTYYVLELKPQPPLPTTMAKGWQSSCCFDEEVEAEKGANTQPPPAQRPHSLQ